MAAWRRRVVASAVTLVWTLAVPAAPVHAAAVETPHVTAELIAQRSAVQPGQPVQIGLRLQHIPHWHTYWRNPGDSGLPTTLNWTLPAGSGIGQIAWPAPRRLPIGPLVNYGYEGDLLLPLSYTAPADASPGSTLSLRAKADWLVCKEVCIPESATLELRLPVVDAQTTPGASVHTPRFERAAAQQAVPWRGGQASVQQAGRELLLTLEFNPPRPAAGKLPAVHVFPYAEQLLEPARHTLYQTAGGYAVKLALMDGAQAPATIDAIAVVQADPAPGASTIWGNSHRAVEFSAPVRVVPAIQLPDGATPLPTGSGTALPQRGNTDLGLLAALALALVGGMLLNLMPCVFPVLSIKLLSLVRHTDRPRALRIHALAYSAGVVLSFVALAGALLALRAAGSAVGWGFQLQEPGVVFVLALLFFAIGLNLLGAFELGHLLPQRLAQWRSQRPALDAFGAGMLAVVAASPCTAPFMGAALGFAFTQPATLALAVFAVLGAGMALPYVLLVLLPGWRARLPRPGAWMLHLRQALAFPLLATVVWLVWVLGQQAGIDAAAQLLLALVGFSVLVWGLGLPSGRGLVARVFGTVALVALLAWSWPATLPREPTRATPAAAAAPSLRAADTLSAAWQPYDEAVLAQRLAQGQPVFVDFTAAWCVSCQVNKRLVLNTDASMQAFAQSGVALMRADWTRRDDVITQALARLGRSGVPVYALFAPGREPVLLPEILTHRTLREALAALPDPRS